MRPFVADHLLREKRAAAVLVCGSHPPLGDVNCDTLARDVGFAKALMYVLAEEAPTLLVLEVCNAYPSGSPIEVRCEP